MSGYPAWQGLDPFLEQTTTTSDGRRSRSPYNGSLLGGGASNNNNTTANNNNSNTNSPCFDGYDPSVLLASGSSDGPTLPGLGAAASQQQQQLAYGYGSAAAASQQPQATQHLYHPSTSATRQHHQHHHQLLMSALPGMATTATYTTNSPHHHHHHSMAVTTTTTTINHLDMAHPFLSQQQQQQQPPPQFGVDTSAEALQNTYNSLVAASAAAAPSAAASATATATTSNSNDPQQQQQLLLQDSGSIDPLMLMSANLFAGGGDTNSSGLDSITPPPGGISSGFSSTGVSDAGIADDDDDDDNNKKHNEEDNDEWLDEIQLTVSALSLEPMSGKEILTRVKQSVQDVTNRYIPCVDFLVHCQQDLRKGLLVAQKQQQQHRRYHRGSSRYGGGGGMTPTQFYKAFVQPLPEKFWMNSQAIMEGEALQQAMTGLNTLLHDAQKEKASCEAVKNQFLGGMKDGESWGLRKWLSRNGNALTVCTNLECLTNAVQKLDRNAPATVKLAAALRPLASAALKRLRQEIPASYQEVSAAHPYLPFFHRLEAALRSMSNYDPADDDVICIDSDDDDDDVVEVVSSSAAVSAPPKKKPPPPAAAANPRKRKREVIDYTNQSDEEESVEQSKVAAANNNDDDGGGNNASSSSGEEESDVEIIVLNDSKPSARRRQQKQQPPQQQQPQQPQEEWMCPGCFTFCAAACAICASCGKTRPDDFQSQLDNLAAFDGASADANDDEDDVFGCTLTTTTTPPPPPATTWPVAVNEVAARSLADAMAENLIKLAIIFETNQQDLIRPPNHHHRQQQQKSGAAGSFWDGDRYGAALRVFGTVLQSPDCCHFVERAHFEDITIRGKHYAHVIKNPLCFRDIVAALISNEHEELDDLAPSAHLGKLPRRGLSNWNMWQGMDLLQAVDLVLLNSLAYGKAINDGKSSHRSLTNKLRKKLWNGISGIVSRHVGQDPERRRQCTPIRRSETSGFVVYKFK